MSAALAGVVALAAAGLGAARSAEVGPFAPERYCWGAWDKDTSPDLLGDPPVGDQEITATEKAPTPGEPLGDCTVRVSNPLGETSVSVTYGRPLEGLDLVERAGWLAESVGSDAVPLPGGLPGVAGWRRGLLALPEACDVADQATFVSLSVGTTDPFTEGGELSDVDGRVGGVAAVGEMLVRAAQRGMELAGCAPGERLDLSAAWPRLPEDGEPLYDRDDDACRIRGLTFPVPDDIDPALDPAHQVGTVGDTLQSCSLSHVSDFVTPDVTLLMTSEPWLTDVFGDRAAGGGALPDGWRGSGSLGERRSIVRAECGDRAVVFVMRADPAAPVFGSAAPGAFATFANAAAHRTGCAPVAPVS